jgi:hypothetical protein
MTMTFASRSEGDWFTWLIALAIIDAEEKALLTLATAGVVTEGVTMGFEIAEYTAKEKERDNRDASYKKDHTALGSVVWRDFGPDIAARYGTLTPGNPPAADELSFVTAFSREKFDEQNPGYREAGDTQYVNFADAYTARVNNLQSSAYNILLANNQEAQFAVLLQGYMSNLNDASLGAYGYRQLAQAGNQREYFANQGLSTLRADEERLTDARVRFALNERQERADALSAFSQAVRTWKDQSSGGEY